MPCVLGFKTVKKKKKKVLKKEKKLPPLNLRFLIFFLNQKGISPSRKGPNEKIFLGENGMVGGGEEKTF